MQSIVESAPVKRRGNPYRDANGRLTSKANAIYDIRANPYHDKAGKFAAKSGKAVGTGESAKVTIDGKQYGIGDSIMVNGQEHHIADISSDKVTVRPGKSPSRPTKGRKYSATKETPIAEKPTSSAEMGPVSGGAKTTKEVKEWAAAQKFSTPKEHEREALRNYSSKSYTEVNGRLRRGKGELDVGDPYGQQVWDMDQYMKRSTIKADTTVSRKVGSWMFGEGTDLTKLKGKTFRDHGYVSTTLLTTGPKDGESRRWKAMDVTMSIRVPKGTRAAYMEDLTAVKGQYELLLARGTNFRFVDVKRGRDGKWLMVMEVIQ